MTTQDDASITPQDDANRIIELVEQVADLSTRLEALETTDVKMKYEPEYDWHGFKNNGPTITEDQESENPLIVLRALIAKIDHRLTKLEDRVCGLRIM